ncbi:uncharacterized protein LOC120930586 [Rana temporaria]|uniref:uncharacterized protein LOC120930586 n=1 Tax=Rana temporaria TaxID=8407 RepID=UPI001AAC8D83|nr:uncharacterized protein LOC120930586 [Rana temporaria]
MSDRDSTESPAFNEDKADSLLHSAHPAGGPHPSLKAREVYEASKEETSSKLTALWHKTLSCIKTANETSNNPEQLNTALSRVKKAFENYKRLSEKFYSLLSHSSMEEAAVELKDFTSTDQQRYSTYLEAKAQIEGRLAQLHETTSCKSASSRHSGKSSRSARSYHKSSSKSLRSCSVRSTLSDQIVKARQKVAAAQVQAACSEREAAIKAEAKRIQAETEAQLEILQKSKEKEVALAELFVLEQALLEEEGAACPSLAACQDPIERTLQFVLSQNHDITVPPTVGDFSHNHPACGPEGNMSQNQAGQLDTPANRDTPQLPHVTKSSESTYAAHVPPYANRDYKGTAKDYRMNSMTPVKQFSSTSNAQRPLDIRPLPRLNPSATPFAPPTSQLQIPTMAQVGAPSVSPVAIKTESINATELSKSMALQELITTGLYKFDDRPENYRSWRSTFKAVIKSLPVEPQAELDLLIRYSGRQSSEQVKRLKSVYIYNFNAGLDAAWERLDQDYGSPEVIESALFQRLNDFPKISVKDNHKLRELGDLLHELEIAKLDPSLPGLSYLDTAQGVNPIVARLPSYLQGKWTSVGSKYKYEHHVSFPPFSYFAEFVRKVAKSKNDPSFFYPDTTTTPLTTSRGIATNSKFKDLKYPIAVRKTEVASNVLATGIKASNLNQQCPIHNAPHSLSKCRAFKDKPIEERKSFLKEHNICFKCCASSDHLARDCKITIRCSLCNSAKHVDALHSDLFKRKPSPGSNPKPTSDDGGERSEQHANPVTTRCTEVCGEGLHSKSCSKICLVRVFPEGCPQNSIKMYAILDDQSNRSLASPEFFDLFNIHGEAWFYTLQTCAGKINTSGRRAHGFIVASEYEDIEFPLPTLIECDQLPNNREEIPIPEAARHHPHLSHIADYIPPLNKDVKILILLGRDVPRVHKIRELCNGPDDAPQAQKLDLGWVIIGEVCLDQSHKLLDVASYKTNVAYRSMKCPLHYYVKERLDFKNEVPYQPLQGINCKLTSQKDLGDSVYQTTCDDNKIAPSVEDKEFIKIMDKEFFKDNSNSWVAPLPFRVPRLTLPNNRGQALTRFAALKKTLCNKPEMQEHFLAFMQKILDNLHAEPAPDLKEGEECWYLPSFGVYHPRKPGQIRIVFDSSAQFQGTSLNNVLLTGPNLTNNLVGVLMRFRKEPIAVTVDVQQMFHCFIVKEDHRNYLRFLWHRNNNINDQVIDYRMRVHVFGNSPSPAVATYGLRRTAQEGKKEFGSDTRQFIERDFYVDDGLKSFSTPEEAVNLIKRAQQLLSTANLRLHKIASNSSEVMRSFNPEDHAKDLKDLDLGVDALPTQRSLGLLWNITSDTFTFQVSDSKKPFTRRGVLSTVNSLYDPLGFVTPVTVQGRSILRQLTERVTDWDAPLPVDLLPKWEKWRNSMKSTERT